jgi:hypothetical protein
MFPLLDACALCSGPGPLQRSHIVPDFAVRRLRASPTGTFRDVRILRQPLQTGISVHLLCKSCEQTFSIWEHQFQQTFFPRKENANLPIVYGNWLAPFAASVSWRALTYLKLSRPNTYVHSTSEDVSNLVAPLAESDHDSADEALVTWREFLLSRRTSLTPYPQRLIFLNGTNFLGEMCQVVSFLPVSNPDFASIVTHIGPIVVLGMLRDAHPSAWGYSAIVEKGGRFDSTSQSVPPSFAEWLRRFYAIANEVAP